MKVDIEIPFWGFYESIHDSNIDQAIEEGFNYNYETGEEVELTEEFYDAMYSADISWSVIHSEYAKAYTEAFGELFGLDLEYVEMTSPREYNFSTDRIFAKVPLEQINKIRKEVEAHPDYPGYIKERFTSRSGFWSFYSADHKDEEWTREVLDECQYRTILDFYIENISTEHEDWQVYLMDDFRGNGGMDEIVNDAIEAVRVAMKEGKVKQAIESISKAVDWMRDEYGQDYLMSTFAYESVQELQHAIKLLEEANVKVEYESNR